MKKTKMNKLIPLTVAGMFFSAGAVHAADTSNGTVNFNGEIVSTTCQVTAPGGVINVTLPTVSSTAFSAANDRAGKTDFQIGLQNCTPASGQVGVQFEGASGVVDHATGNYMPDATSTAGNVQIGVYDQADTHLAANGAAGGFVTVNTDGSALLPLSAWYVATAAAVTPGTIKTQAQFVLSYK